MFKQDPARNTKGRSRAVGRQNEIEKLREGQGFCPLDRARCSSHAGRPFHEDFHYVGAVQIQLSGSPGGFRWIKKVNP